MSSAHPRFATAFLCALVLPLGGCASFGPMAVTPGEIPDLEAKLRREPANGQILLRYSAALWSGGRCEEALTAAARGRELRPEDPLGPLVQGGCLEEAGQSEEAIRLYADFTREHGDAPGVKAVEARREQALRRWATELARRALQFEDSLAAVPPDPEAVAVLPLFVDGSPEYQPLSVGLAHMIVTDLSLLERFRLVERVRMQALLDELRLQSGERVDPATAARTGHLLRAGRIVQGSVAIPSREEARLASALVLPTGEVAEPFATEGAFRDLLRMEKAMVLGVVESLGYELSQAERQRILESGTRDLMAFLAFSRGLMAEDRGDFRAAAGFYMDAARQDPSFSEAAERQTTAAALDVVATSSPREATILAARVGEALGEEGEAVGSTDLGGALGNAVMDIASLQSERASRTAGADNGLAQLIGNTGVVSASMVDAIVQIIIRIPG